jgi:hypothetical protein
MTKTHSQKQKFRKTRRGGTLDRLIRSPGDAAADSSLHADAAADSSLHADAAADSSLPAVRSPDATRHTEKSLSPSRNWFRPRSQTYCTDNFKTVIKLSRSGYCLWEPMKVKCSGNEIYKKGENLTEKQNCHGDSKYSSLLEKIGPELNHNNSEQEDKYNGFLEELQKYLKDEYKQIITTQNGERLTNFKKLFKEVDQFVRTKKRRLVDLPDKDRIQTNKNIILENLQVAENSQNTDYLNNRKKFLNKLMVTMKNELEIDFKYISSDMDRRHYIYRNWNSITDWFKFKMDCIKQADDFKKKIRQTTMRRDLKTKLLEEVDFDYTFMSEDDLIRHMDSYYENLIQYIENNPNLEIADDR